MIATPEEMLEFTRLSLVICFSWPPPKNASNLRMWCTDILWWLSVINALFIELGLLRATFASRHDGIMMTKIICSCSGVLNLFNKMVTTRLQRQRLRSIIDEMEELLKCAEMSERRMFTQLFNGYAVPAKVGIVTFYGSAAALCFGPLILPQPLPVDADYPFDFENLPTFAIIYALQFCCVWQCGATCMTDIQLSMIIGFAATRFKILAKMVESVVDESELRRCIITHQQLLRFADDVQKAIRYTALSTIFNYTVVGICSGIQVIGHQPTFVKLQYGCMTAMGTITLCVYIWPADKLTEMSTAVGWAAYSTPWIGKSAKMLRSYLLLLLRSQKSVVIGAGSLIPELSFSYYSKYLSTMFSYFTTLRLVVDSDTS